jgi:toxin YoeB
MTKNKKTANKLQAKSIAVGWTDHAWEDYLYWHKQDRKIFEVINELIEECRRTPFAGTGKPEPLKHDLSGLWSRRIDRQHRLVYLPADNAIYVVACRYHY